MCLSGTVNENEKILKQTDSLRYKNSENGIITDTKTGLVWSSKDNGYKISWYDARSYCENYKGGGLVTGGCLLKKNWLHYIIKKHQENIISRH